MKDLTVVVPLYNKVHYIELGIWNGDVWKAFVKIRSERNDVFTCMIEDCDYGLGIISWGNQEPIKLDKPAENLLYDDFKKNKNYLMNCVKLKDYLDINKGS